MKTSKFKTNKFKVGELYTKDGEILKFEKYDDFGDPIFTHHSGKSFYDSSLEGYIPFLGCGADFYKVISL
jgi:hypothetical protein